MIPRLLARRLMAAKIVALCFLFSSASAADITQSQAETALAAALEKAEIQGTLMNVAIVDVGANLKALCTYLGSIDVAIKKAKTARFFNTATGNLSKITQPGGAIFNIELTNGGLVTFPGGVPLKNKKGEIIGAIGVSGGTINDDHEVVMAAVKVLSE